MLGRQNSDQGPCKPLGLRMVSVGPNELGPSLKSPSCHSMPLDLYMTRCSSLQSHGIPQLSERLRTVFLFCFFKVPHRVVRAAAIVVFQLLEENHVGFDATSLPSAISRWKLGGYRGKGRNR